MAVYFITGKLGSGKTLAGVSKIQRYLLDGRRVATNLDIYTDELLPANNKEHIIRLPDKPRASDLYDMGTGDNNHWEDNQTYDESRFGALVLDECATWLNTRNYRDKERAAFIEYLLHARKYRWDVYFFVQDEKAIDKQILEALCEHLVEVKRLDRISIPMFTFWVSLLTFGFVKIKFPKVHLALVRYGVAKGTMVVDRWFMYGSRFYSSYRTGQVFSDDRIYLDNDFIDMRASYCVLSAWHIKGRYKPDWRQVMIAYCNKLIRKLTEVLTGRPPAARAAKVGLLKTDCNTSVFLSDGITPRVSYLVRTISDGSAPKKFPLLLPADDFNQGKQVTVV
jgi:hypothetical protein